MQLQPEQGQKIGSVVSTGPRFSQTYVHLRDRVARAARAEVEERFSINRSAERLLDLFVPAMEMRFRPAQSLWPILLPVRDETAAELKDDPEDRGGGRVEPCLN